MRRVNAGMTAEWPRIEAALEIADDDLWGGIFWVREGDQMVSATPGQSAAEIARLRETLREIRRDIIEAADDVVWMRGGIETVCDRITAVLGDHDE